jgi:DinB superfamily
MQTTTRRLASGGARQATLRAPRTSAELAAYRSELLRLLQEAFAGPAWHGSSLRATLRGVDADEALWQAPGTRNRIWDLVNHAAYTRHLVRRRLAPSTVEDFPMVVERSWWPRMELNGLTPEAAWRRDRALLDTQHGLLVELVRSLPAKRLGERRPGKKHVFGVEISGVALHDTYHGGQIALIRRMKRELEP